MDNVTITRIKPSRTWQFINIREVIEYKDLMYFLVLRGVKAKYAQSILGVGWAVIQPLVTTVVFTIIFGRLAGVSSDGSPYFLFSLCGMVPWIYFANTLSDSANSLIVNSNMISKVYFPRVVLPLSAGLSKLLDFLIGFIVLVIFLFIYRMEITVEIVVVPLLLVILLLSSLGLGMLLSAMAIQYRDIKHALSFMTQLLMYLAPVVYPASKVPENFQLIYALNPMVGVIEGFRSALLHTQPLPWTFIAIATAVGTALFIAGGFYFRRTERIFADVA